MLFNKAYKIRDWETGEERKTPDGGDLLAIATVSEIVKGPSDLDRSFWMVASSQTRDRDGDVIRAKGWNLKNYRKNPVGLWMHQYRDLPVFTVPDIKVDGDRLMALMHFPEDLGGLSDDVYRAFQAKALRASSVGFGAEEINTDPKKRADFGLPEDAGFGNGMLFWKTELWELSAVTVPSNPDALAQIKSLDGAEKLKEMLARSEEYVIELSLDDCEHCSDTGYIDHEDEHGTVQVPCNCDKGLEFEDQVEDEDLELARVTLEQHGYKVVEPGQVLADDLDTMKSLLENAGYIIQPQPVEDGTPEPQPVDLVFRLEEFPAKVVEQLAGRIVAESVKSRVRKATTRAINYQLGKLED